jgi:hypothetical protein
MRLVEVGVLFQLDHDVAHRRRGDVQLAFPNDQPGAYGFTDPEVVLDDHIEDVPVFFMQNGVFHLNHSIRFILKYFIKNVNISRNACNINGLLDLFRLVHK